MADILSALRLLMASHIPPLDALVVPSEDYHQVFIFSCFQLAVSINIQLLRILNFYHLLIFRMIWFELFVLWLWLKFWNEFWSIKSQRRELWNVVLLLCNCLRNWRNVVLLTCKCVRNYIFAIRACLGVILKRLKLFFSYSKSQITLPLIILNQFWWYQNGIWKCKIKHAFNYYSLWLFSFSFCDFLSE